MGIGLADPEFVRLGEALQARHRVRGRVRRTAATLACAVPALRERVPGLAELPRLGIVCSATEAGRRMAAKYGGHRHGVPRSLAVSVLALPEQAADYLRGRSKQALRTNSRRARVAGVTCRRMGRVEADVRLTALLRARREADLVDGVRADLASGLCEAWVALDADGLTEVAALVSVDGPLARLDLMLSAPGRDAGPSRYLLSAELFVALADRGVTHVAVDTALFLDAGLRHFQRLLGFTPVTLDVVGVPESLPVPRMSPASGPMPAVVERLPAGVA